MFKKLKHHFHYDRFTEHSARGTEVTSTSFEDDFAALNGVRNSNLQNNEAATYGNGMIYVSIFITSV